MKKLIIFLIGVMFLCTYCKREKDTITTHNLKGIVFNNCTDSGLANVTVYLRNGNKILQSTVSETNGNFRFNNAEIHSSSKYNYNVFIESKSGTNATKFEDCGFTGTTIYFKHNEADAFFKPRVTPRFLLFVIYCNKIPVTNVNDSVIYYCTNYTFHKNVPDYPYRWGGGGYGLGVYTDNNGGYPMGKYIIDINYWKTGIKTIKNDSIYLNWGANTTYTINW
jgi:hypothetical protein